MPVRPISLRQVRKAAQVSLVALDDHKQAIDLLQARVIQLESLLYAPWRERLRWLVLGAFRG